MNSIPLLKCCTKCGVEKPATREYFYLNSKAKDKLTYQCKECIRAGCGYKSHRRPLMWASDGVPDGYKRCTKCEKIYPATSEYFTRAAHGMYGLDAQCKQCKRKYALDNAGHIADYHKGYYQQNKEYWKVRGRARYLANRDVIIKQSKEYHAAHPEQTRETKRRYKVKNPGIGNHHSRIRRARLLNVPSEFSYAEWVRCLEYFDYKCVVCGRLADLWTRIVADHWYPIAKGGPDIAVNIIPLCQEKPGCPVGSPCCNSSKNAKDPVQWLESFVGKRKSKVILNRINTYFEWVKAQREVAA